MVKNRVVEFRNNVNEPFHAAASAEHHRSRCLELDGRCRHVCLHAAESSHSRRRRWPHRDGAGEEGPGPEDQQAPDSVDFSDEYFSFGCFDAAGYLDTPLIESMVIGTPTVGLWNPVRWPLLRELEPLFARLRELGIIHTDPAAAAAHIDAVYDEVALWWDSAELVRARTEFVERLAIPGDWPAAWAWRLRELRDPTDRRQRG